MKKILVVGSINEDTTLQMKSLPLPGETVIASELKTSIGGKGANQAVAAARMGADVSFIGAVGKEKSADSIIETLTKDGIITTGIERLDINTGSAYISIDNTAENNIIVFPGANFAFTEEHLYNNIRLFEESDYCLIQLEVPMNIIRETIKICKDKDVKVILNPAPYNNDVDEEILNGVDFYIPNELEFLSTINEDTSIKHEISWIEEKGKEFAKKHDLTLVVTLGSRGAMLFKEDKTTLVPVHKTSPVDTTAAGDSFIGGFLSSLSKGNDIVESLDFGSKVAAITISRYGAISAIPTLDEIK